MLSHRHPWTKGIFTLIGSTCRFNSSLHYYWGSRNSKSSVSLTRYLLAARCVGTTPQIPDINPQKMERESLHQNSKIKDSFRIVKLALLGNLVITCAKGAVWLNTGSSAMLSETIHSLVDFGNQALLLVGLRSAQNVADPSHQYGYGKQIYFWSLISALGTFWFGAGITCLHSIKDILEPAMALNNLGYHVWCVLGLSFVVDGYVLSQTVKGLLANKPPGVSFYSYVKGLRDPTTAAVLMEDGAACTGVLIAASGLAASHFTNTVVWDGYAGLAISGLLGAMGIYLVRLNQNFLLGQSVEPEITNEIRNILMARPSVEGVHSVQSQWNGPHSFSYKAEVDFDGTYLAASLLERYQKEFLVRRHLTQDEIRVLLAWFAEDVMRTVEKEVREVEAEIRQKFPEAQYIELEPDGAKASSKTYAIDDGRSSKGKSQDEIDLINFYIGHRRGRRS